MENDMGTENTVDLRKFNLNLSNPEEVMRYINELEVKINVMRSVLWEWNCSSGPVWEYYRLQSVGEIEEDYKFIVCDDFHEPSEP